MKTNRIRGVSKVVATVLAIVMLVAGIGIGLIIAPYFAGAGVGAAAGGLSGEVPIGALLPLTGALAAFGENDKIAIEAAVQDVNQFLEKVGASWRLKLYVEDTETNPSVALEKLTTLYAKGVRVVIGPMASSEVRNLKEYADSNKILIISQSSTDPSLAIAGDHVYRFVPVDIYQGRIGPLYAKALGATHMILVWRGDAWGDGLSDVVKKTAKEIGLTIAGEIRYDPEAKEFSAEVAKLAETINKLVGEGVPPEKIVVQLISFGEARAFFLTATEYDILWKVHWFGSDGNAYDYSLQEDPKVAEFVASVKFPCPIAAPIGDKYIEVMKKVKDKIGRTPEPYAYNSYDAVWAVALAILSTGKYDADAIISVLPDILKFYYGASGYIELNEYGDRVGKQYWLVSLVKTDGEYDWKPVGIYDCEKDEVILK